VKGHAAQQAKSVASQLSPRLREHNLTLVSAGVAFYAFLAFVPTLIAVVSVYGLVADPDDVRDQIDNVAGALPEELRDFLEYQLTQITNANRAGVSITLVVAIALALWSASGGMAALVTGINVAHEAEEPKSFVAKRGKALLLTLGAVIVLVVLVWLLAFLPAFIEEVGLGDAGRLVFSIVRWPVLALLMVLALSTLSRIAVSEPYERSGWRGLITPGAIAGTALWLVVSLLFSFYTSNFASYSKTYGALASIVVVLLWLFLSVMAVLIGAEVDSIRTSPEAESR
jgi:membrane protein